MARGGRLAFLALCLGVLESGKCFQHGVHVPLRSAIRARSSRSWNGSPAAPWTAATRSSSLLHERTVPFSGAWKRVRTRFSGKHFVLMSAADDAGNLDLIELERQFEARIAEAVPSLVEALNAGPGAVAIVDNLLGAEACQAMRSEAIAVTEQDLLCGSASAYSTAPPDTFEARYGDEPGISATVLTRGTRAARRGKLVHVEEEGREADHQLRLTTVAQQAHMDNSFDGVNCRLVTTLYYLNPSWDPSHGGRFLPWPCSDDFAAESARSAELPATVLTYQDLPAEAQRQIPERARDRVRLSISRKLAPSHAYEALVARERRPQAPVEPRGDRLVAFYSDELLHSVAPVLSRPLPPSLSALHRPECGSARSSLPGPASFLRSAYTPIQVEPVTAAPLIRDSSGALRVHDAGRFAISLWLPAPSTADILASNPAQKWAAQLRNEDPAEGEDPIGGTLKIEESDEPLGAAAKPSKGFGGGGGVGKKGKRKKK